MLPKWHILYGFIFSLVLINFFNFSLFSGLIVFLASVFIDLDHVLFYFLKTKNLNPWKFYNWSMTRRKEWLKLTNEERKIYKFPYFVLHGIELIIVLVALSYLHIFFFWILLGILLHFILDISELAHNKFHISYKTSQIWLWQRNKNRKEFVVE